MNRVSVLVGITVLAVLAGCAKKEAPQAQAEDDDVGATVTQVQPAAAQPEAKTDRAKSAADMASFLDPSPQCQVYRDALVEKGSAAGSVDELSEIFVQASKAGCGKKKQQ